MRWDYKLAHRTIKSLKRFPEHDRRRIVDVLENMRDNPFAGDVKRMRGEERLYRRRVGNYRIYFCPDTAVHIFDVPEISRRQTNQL